MLEHVHGFAVVVVAVVDVDWANRLGGADGDLDLLLGSYENGHLYRQMNEGTKTAPKFTGKNIAVMVGDTQFGLPAKMTAPRMLDWDADGDLDILVGSFGDSYGARGEGGGVYLSLNEGEKGKPPFLAGGIPRFVETRGGDYFFLPSLTALRMLGDGIVDPT